MSITLCLVSLSAHAKRALCCLSSAAGTAFLNTNVRAPPFSSVPANITLN